MKRLLLLLTICISSISFGQSKKRQIEILIVSNDSIQSLLEKEREAHSTSNKTFTNQILEFNNQISSLILKSGTQKSRIINLESQLKVKEQENLTQKNTIDNLNSQLKNKTDSLLILEAELLNYRPKPKPKKPEIVEDIKSGFKTVKIGGQVWMAENLNVSTFRNGDPIPQARTEEEWKKLGENKQAAWCYYDYDPANGKKYGKLYNYYATRDSKGLAPNGWHIPKDSEWETLLNHLDLDEGKKMKSKSGWNTWKSDITCSNCKNWNAEYRSKTACHVCKDTRVNGKKTNSGNGTNSSGFSGLPGGFSNPYVGSKIGEKGMWWSSSYDRNGRAVYFGLRYEYDFCESRPVYNLQWGYSVRCIKD